MRALVARVARWTVGLVLAALLATVVQVIALRWVDPPLTWTMVERGWDTGRWPAHTWRDLDELGANVPRAAVASEDGWFWWHHGFDVSAIEKAVAHNATHRTTRGASTISQQVARNVFLWQARSWPRKALEVWYTVLLELLVPKARILEVYLNVAESSPRTFGLEAGAQHWFGKPARALSMEEAARLVAILPSPQHWTPTGKVASGRVQVILDHRVPFPGDKGFDAMGAKAPAAVGWRALWK